MRSQRNICAFIGSLVQNFTEAEECLQETAVQVFEHPERFDSSKVFLPYAIGVARNVVLQHQRRMGRSLVVFDQEAIDRLAAVFCNLPERDATIQEALRSCYDKLPDRSKRLCQMRYEEGLLPQDIAPLVGTTGGSVRILLGRIRQQLKGCIERRLNRELGLS
ncbi:sigma-70 family RNA polymerase sigma factor [Planctomicrobium sp. SH661]|uniref:sigma-70 family RNA polymerase sigma factor n=1 Tax=Planctomicrobium sp. SH661 TaxID=3448124 RepID=UPI003F5C947A